ncbi:hypothetical protein BU26DRAFT_513770 [Trematosphaeria pertusa]|uniref:Uncharacterized protein n=1 Tax=Trematosphaeria pertusa TaxID=390896 RepID=A0A6A6J395_9PLEO|nr:uncharacterized protein BU26DRAFT_513770 [Trematosphaeria pertusa]KAF2257048.1 hypothetical protein BU26DRAFT_513770 [Trematosphaeria pertusa]
MDSRQPHPLARPPERTLIHNPNHQSPSQPPHTQPFPGYAPATSQPQPPVHVPFTADPYPTSRRDPFLPPASQHVRRSSYGVPGAEGTAQGDRHGAWGNIGTLRGCGPHSRTLTAVQHESDVVLDVAACLRHLHGSRGPAKGCGRSETAGSEDSGRRASLPHTLSQTCGEVDARSSRRTGSG